MKDLRELEIMNRFSGTKDALDKLIPHRMAFRDDEDDGTINYRISVVWDEWTYNVKLNLIRWLQRLVWNTQSRIRVRLKSWSEKLAHIENQARLGA